MFDTAVKKMDLINSYSKWTSLNFNDTFSNTSQHATEKSFKRELCISFTLIHGFS